MVGSDICPGRGAGYGDGQVRSLSGISAMLHVYATHLTRMQIVDSRVVCAVVHDIPGMVLCVRSVADVGHLQSLVANVLRPDDRENVT